MNNNPNAAHFPIPEGQSREEHDTNYNESAGTANKSLGGIPKPLEDDKQQLMG